MNMMNYFMGYNHPMNVIENSDEWIIELRAIGLTREDISLEYEPNGSILLIKSPERDKTEEEGYNRHEFWNDWFDTRIQLPAGIDSEGITAKVEKGILVVNIKKDKKSNRKIEIG